MGSLLRKSPLCFNETNSLDSDDTVRWTYVPSDGPAYRTGHTINLVGQIVVVCLSLFGIFYCIWENKLRAAGKRDYRLEGRTEEEISQLGYRHPEFRYIK